MNHPPRRPVKIGRRGCLIPACGPTDLVAMAEASNLATLMAQGIVTESEVAQAVDANLSEPTTTLFVTYGGHRLNLAEAVGAHPFEQQTACAPWTSEKLKRQLVRMAILQARPVKA